MTKFLLVFLQLLTLAAFAVDDIKKNDSPKPVTLGLPTPSRIKVITKNIKRYLEEYHYRKMRMDDDISEKAFAEYLKRIDFGRQFLLKDDVKRLEKFERQVDDEMGSGELTLVHESMVIMEKRIQLVEDFRKKFFKQKLDFTKKEYYELDPEKREFQETFTELRDHWRKSFKHAVLMRYLSLKDEQSDAKEKDKKKKKKAKKLTHDEMMAKAKKAISKRYKTIFGRLLKDDVDDYLEKFINAVAMIYDPHTNYFPPKRKEDFDIDMSGSLEGIGAVLQEDDGYIKVVKIMPGGAAWKQRDLEVDDLILAAAQGNREPVDLVDMRVDDAVRHIRGKKGTVVKLTVKKADGSRKVIPIERDVIQISESFAKSSVLELKKQKIKVGYIHVPKFYRDFSNIGERNCTDDVRKELRRLKKKKVSGIILDLRNNGGGSLEDAKQMSGLFIKNGPIVQVKNYSGAIEILNDSDPSIEYGGPLIVLINRYSASASEILAAALKDYGRAVIVGGEDSHGKGTVQAVLPLSTPFASLIGPDLGALKITIQKFYRVSGGSTQYKGVQPHIVLPDPFGYSKNREQDLDYSLPWDEVKPLEINKWKGLHADIRTLSRRSEQRVKKCHRFDLMKERVAYLKKRQDDTNYPLELSQAVKRDAENAEISKKLSDEKKNEELLVSGFDASVMQASKVKKADKKKWLEDNRIRKQDWMERLQKDAIVEEAIFILDDIIKMNKKMELSKI